MDEIFEQHEEAAALQRWTNDWFESLNPETLAEPNHRFGYASSLYATG